MLYSDFVIRSGLLLDGHGERVGCMARYLLDLIPTQAAHVSRRDITAAGRLHDIGKCLIPESILDFPGRLDRISRSTVNLHPTFGHTIATDLAKKHAWSIPDGVLQAILYHHEKWNGTGYPHGLKGADIPFSARVISCVDMIDAILSPRSYKPAMSVDKLKQILISVTGEALDPDIARIAIRNLHQLVKEGRMAGLREDYRAL